MAVLATRLIKLSFPLSRVYVLFEGGIPWKNQRFDNLSKIHNHKNNLVVTKIFQFNEIDKSKINE